ncbi:hypothetical protein E5D57_007670 [Metarhizium anisopliae]|nr:hypothetical protein E5D57_007670 [Metarhizium anisopliae]
MVAAFNRQLSSRRRKSYFPPSNACLSALNLNIIDSQVNDRNNKVFFKIEPSKVETFSHNTNVSHNLDKTRHHRSSSVPSMNDLIKPDTLDEGLNF